ncbi:MAG: sulfotransferase domain-containing protein [Haloferacaceae archaeon]
MTATRSLSDLLLSLRLDLYETLPTPVARLRHGTADFLKCGYPKSGNNWVHFLIANAIVGAAGRTDDVHFRNNDEWLSTTVPKEPPVDGFPRMLSNTDPYDDQQYLDADTDVLYIVRHPGDVMESFYHYRKYRWNDDVGTFSEFIRGERWGVPAWRAHVESWEGNWDVLVRFEDLKQDSLAELRRIVELFDHAFDEATLEYAAERSSFETMRRMEEEYGKPERHGANPDYTFMREGSSDRGEAYFDEADYRYLDRAAGDAMDRYGYETPI